MTQTVQEYTHAQLHRLCDVVGVAPDEPTSLLTDLLGAVGHRKIDYGPMWPSDISDDGTPVEFSIAIDDDGKRAVRILGEAVAPQPGLKANAAAARALLTSLADRYSISLDDFHTVEDLFLPSHPQGNFSLWTSFICRPHHTGIKVYFNPAIRGDEHAAELVAEGFQRLDFPHAWQTTTQFGLIRDGRDKPVFFSLDLDRSPSARVKLYIAHEAARAADTSWASRAVDGIDPEKIRDFCSLLGGDTDIFARRPLVSSYTWTARDTAPSNYSLYLPIRSYVRDDQEAYDRVRKVMSAMNRDPAELDELISAVSNRRLRDGVGLIAHVSLRLGGGRSGITVYLSSEAYGGTKDLS